MITLQFVKTWLKFAALTVVAVIVERGTIRHTGWFATISGITLLIFAGITLALLREWKAEQGEGPKAYHYSFVEHLDRD